MWLYFCRPRGIGKNRRQLIDAELELAILKPKPTEGKDGAGYSKKAAHRRIREAYGPERLQHRIVQDIAALSLICPVSTNRLESEPQVYLLRWFVEKQVNYCYSITRVHSH